MRLCRGLGCNELLVDSAELRCVGEEEGQLIVVDPREIEREGDLSHLVLWLEVRGSVLVHSQGSAFKFTIAEKKGFFRFVFECLFFVFVGRALWEFSYSHSGHQQRLRSRRARSSPTSSANSEAGSATPGWATI